MNPDSSAQKDLEGLIETSLTVAFETVRRANDVDPLRHGLEFLAGLLSDVPEDFAGPALLCREGKSVQIYPVRQMLTFGRSKECTISAPGFREISRRHFSIRREREIFWLVDEATVNGTFVRGQRVHRHELRDGDVIAAAGFAFAFVRE